MEDNCDLPTDMMISVQADGDSWIAVVAQEGPAEDAGRRQTIEQLAAQLKAEFDLKQAGTILAEVRTNREIFHAACPTHI
jgi:hypothetical protein